MIFNIVFAMAAEVCVDFLFKLRLISPYIQMGDSGMCAHQHPQSLSPLDRPLNFSKQTLNYINLKVLFKM
jgi:hypothetical protein